MLDTSKDVILLLLKYNAVKQVLLETSKDVSWLPKGNRRLPAQYNLVKAVFFETSKDVSRLPEQSK